MEFHGFNEVPVVELIVELIRIPFPFLVGFPASKLFLKATFYQLIRGMLTEISGFYMIIHYSKFVFADYRM